MSSYKDNQFDNLISHSLKDAYGHAEPSPVVWKRIQSQVRHPRQYPQNRSSLHGLFESLKYYVFGMEYRLALVSAGRDNLAQQRAQFLISMLACSNANSIPLAVV